jgi:hypothetical protein
MQYNLLGNTAGTSQVSGGDIQWAGGQDIQLSANGSTISINKIRDYLYSYEPTPLNGLSTASQSVANNSSANVAYFFPFNVGEDITFGAMNMIFSNSYVTSSAAFTQNGGLWAGLYTRGTGASSTYISQFESLSFSWAVTGSSLSNTVSQPTSTNYAGYTYGTQSSNAAAFSSQYTGLKLIAFPYSTSMSPGVYWLGLLGTNKTTGAAGGISLHVVGGVASGAISIAPMGSLSSAFSIGTNPWADWNIGAGSYSSVGNFTSLPASAPLSGITEGAVSVIPYMKFWST